MTTFVNTPKQQEIMDLVVNAAARGEIITVNDLMSRLSYRPKRSAIHCSLKHLKQHGYLITEHHGSRGAYVIPTVMGMTVFKLKPEN